MSFALPLAVSIFNAQSVLDCVIWGLIALIVQVAIYWLVRLALPDLSTMYSAEITQAVADAARERGYGLLVEETGARPEREIELVSRASRHLIDGLILNPVTLDDSAVRAGGDLPPAVLIGEVSPDLTDGGMVARGRPQRYGSQVVQGDDGAMQLRPSEDRAGLDARRSAMGLPSLAEYKAILAESDGKPVN